MKSIFRSILAIILIFGFLVAPTWATESSEMSAISPSEYKFSKSVSKAFCDAVEDSLSVKEALEYGYKQSMWSAFGSILLDSLTADRSEEGWEPPTFEHTGELIERMASKCLNKQQLEELHAYMLQAGDVA